MTNMEILKPTRIIRSKRKAISLIINVNGEFVVRAPINCSDEAIYSFINKKASWITKNRLQVADNLKFRQLSFTNGKKVTLLDEDYVIMMIEGGRLKLNEKTILVPMKDSAKSFKLFLKRLLKTYINSRVREISKLTQLTFKSVSISSAKTNWGSCSFNNCLHFTYKLCLCPKQVVDYVIIHELCHTKIKNHSQSFWSMIKSILPNYKEYENWLKENRTISIVI